jgi:hypothetical protein
VTTPATPEAGDGLGPDTQNAPLPTDDTFPDPADGQPTGEGQQQKQESVPFGRFEYERQRRKEREAEIEQLRQKDAQREERLLQIMEALKPKQEQPQQEVPDRETNPVGYIGHLEQRLAQIEGYTQQTAQQAQQAQQVTEFRQNMVNQFNREAEADPSLRAAMNYAAQRIQAEGAAYGLSGPALQEHVTRTLDENFAYVTQNRIPLGRFVRDFATARGWDGKGPQQQQAPADPAQLQANVDARQQIQRAATSLTPAGGSAARTGPPSPQELLEMTPKQFDEWREKHSLSDAFAA